MISCFCTFIIGAVLIFSGFTKVIDSGKFIRHVLDYRLISPSILVPASMLFIGLETGLGTALVLHVWPQWIIPLTMILFIFMAFLTFWGAGSGRIKDCGCYGGLLAVSPNQSIVLDGIYFLILIPAFLLPVQDYNTGIWKIILSAAMSLLALAVSFKSIHEPLMDFSRLKTGRQWKTKWLSDNKSMSSGSHFVVFMDRECIFCKRWVPLLNVINVQPELPEVRGVMSLSAASLEDFMKEHMIRFPISRMDRFLAATMTSEFPTAVLIENGSIKEKWVGEIPENYLRYIKQFFQSIPKEKEKTSVFTG